MEENAQIEMITKPKIRIRLSYIPWIVGIVFVVGMFVFNVFNTNRSDPPEAPLNLAVCADMKKYVDKNLTLARSLEVQGHHKEAEMLREQTKQLSTDCK